MTVMCISLHDSNEKKVFSYSNFENKHVYLKIVQHKTMESKSLKIFCSYSNCVVYLTNQWHTAVRILFLMSFRMLTETRPYK